MTKIFLNSKPAFAKKLIFLLFFVKFPLRAPDNCGGSLYKKILLLGCVNNWQNLRQIAIGQFAKVIYSILALSEESLSNFEMKRLFTKIFTTEKQQQNWIEIKLVKIIGVKIHHLKDISGKKIIIANVIC